MSLFDGNPRLQPPYWGKDPLDPHRDPLVVIDEDGETRARNTYRDGGTLRLNVVINMVHTQVFRDWRLSSTTRGKWFDRYPGHDGAQELPLELSERLDKFLLEHP